MRDQARREEANAAEENEAVVTEDTESRERFVGGRIPPVEEGFTDQSGASELVFADNANERELKQKVGALVERQFGGDYKKAFAHYDVDHDGRINKSELVSLLADAGVGNGLTRGLWASKIIERLDGDGVRAIQWSEFELTFTARA